MKLPATSILRRFEEVRELDRRAQAIAEEQGIPLCGAYAKAADSDYCEPPISSSGQSKQLHGTSGTPRSQ